MTSKRKIQNDLITQTPRWEILRVMMEIDEATLQRAIERKDEAQINYTKRIIRIRKQEQRKQFYLWN